MQLEDKLVLCQEAEKASLPFPMTYLCNERFLSLLAINTKVRYTSDPQHDLRCAISINIKPRLDKLIKKVQQHHGSL
jgi:hypothetical protein